jgi:hypothetical protein
VPDGPGPEGNEHDDEQDADHQVRRQPGGRGHGDVHRLEEARLWQGGLALVLPAFVEGYQFFGIELQIRGVGAQEPFDVGFGGQSPEVLLLQSLEKLLPYTCGLFNLF